MRMTGIFFYLGSNDSGLGTTWPNRFGKSGFMKVIYSPFGTDTRPVFGNRKIIIKGSDLCY